MKSATALSGKRIKVVWYKQTGADLYVLYRSTTSTGKYAKAIK